jgi:anti-sigma factor ChrR (cupin superfamily)
MSDSPQKPSRSRVAPSQPAETVLDETTALLAHAAPAVTPPPAIKTALLARIHASQAASTPPPKGWHFASVHEATGWKDAPFPGVRFKALSEDRRRDIALLLVELAPGAVFPDHDHAPGLGAEEGLILSGNLRSAGRFMSAGDYYYADEGSPHRDTVSPDGCVALLTMSTRAWTGLRTVLGMPPAPILVE